MRRYGEKVAYDYPIHLVTTPQPFGGVRWWFVCPLSGRRVRVLYLPPVGGTKFACREALGLPYRSQRFSPEDRADERSLKARKKLGVKDQNVIEMPFLAKPKWMRQHTYARLVAIVEDRYEHQVDYAMRRWGVRL